MTATLYIENDFGGYDLVNRFPSVKKAESAMLESFDNGKCADYMIKSEGDGFRAEIHYPSYKLFPENCPRCGKETRPFQMHRTFDYHGIPFRRVCEKCYDAVLKIGYDGVKYGPEDECLDYDY